MQKIVINGGFNGFALSRAAMCEYAARKGFTVYGDNGSEDGGLALWITPDGERPTGQDAYSPAHSIFAPELRRNDPDLIAVVEKFGKAAGTPRMDLKIVEIPDDVKWTIAESEGYEWIAEVHRTWR